VKRSVYLIHWKAAQAPERLRRIRAAGYEATYEELMGPDPLRRLKSDPPAAIVIDLTRLPSHGREVALALRQRRSTRYVPLVFVEGDPEKVARIRTLLPDAVYTSWSRIRSSLKRAIAHPVAEPRVPKSVLEGYSGTPLPKKLGIKPGAAVALVDAPPRFEKTLGPLPDGVTFGKDRRGSADLILWFVRSRADLARGIRRMAARIDGNALWVIWPKKAGALASDVGETDVREAGLAAGLVDYKVCAVDATWSGLKFARRGETRRQPDQITRPSSSKNAR